MTPGKDYYLTNTAGTIALTPGTVAVRAGKALSATQIELNKAPNHYIRTSKVDGTIYRAGARGGILVGQRTGTNSGANMVSDASSTPTYQVGVSTGASVGNGNSTTAPIRPYDYYKTTGMATVDFYEG